MKREASKRLERRQSVIQLANGYEAWGELEYRDLRRLENPRASRLSLAHPLKIGKHRRKPWNLRHMPAESNAKLYNLNRAVSSSLIQAKAGRIGLKRYLATFKRDISGCYNCGYSCQHTKDLVMTCSDYTSLRREIWG